MNRKQRSMLVAGVLALAVTAGSGLLTIGNVSAAEVVEKAVGKFGGKGFSRSVTANTEMATLLGLSSDELKTALKSGKSLAVIAGEQGVDVQKVIALQTTTFTAVLDKHLADGKITQAEYDTQKATSTTQATESVNAVHTGKGFGGRGGFGHMNVTDNIELATLLGTTTEALKTSITAGKSLATLAGENNVPVQAVTDLLTKQFTKELDEKLVVGSITQTQYDEKKATITTKAAELVNRTFTAKDGDKGEGNRGRQGQGDKGQGDKGQGDKGTRGTARTVPSNGTSAE